MEYDEVNEIKDNLKQSFEIIRETINSRESLLDEQIFNALVKKIEVLLPTHFAFILKNGIEWRKL
ncbi:hypothetical protein [Desulfitobacterium sp.]|uniref:hypothetical protein n=1 Tax=Desulfitobacterium sp. TaxID=49981 RepID=UPI002B206CFF|nr:hypothetical protein [Desulfitobacterium sp.]MEA4900712.1 hypothetical protein [Desulfitobacterium sp.]